MSVNMSLGESCGLYLQICQFMLIHKIAFIRINLCDFWRYSIVTLSTHRFRVAGMFLTAIFCELLYRLSLFHCTSHITVDGLATLNYQYMWRNVWMCVFARCLVMDFHRVCSSLYMKCSWKGLQLYCKPYQDKVVSEDKLMI